jgi:hypothetical protein
MNDALYATFSRNTICLRFCPFSWVMNACYNRMIVHDSATPIGTFCLSLEKFNLPLLIRQDDRVTHITLRGFRVHKNQNTLHLEAASTSSCN